MDEDDFDSEEFHREHFRAEIQKARGGGVEGIESAWYIISTFVDWAEGAENPSPITVFLADFFGKLVEIKADKQPAYPSKEELAGALAALCIVQRRGKPKARGTSNRPPAPSDAVLRRLAHEELLRRPKSEGGQGMRADEARDYLTRLKGRGDRRQRDIRAANQETIRQLKLLTSQELDAIANDGEIASDPYLHSSRALDQPDAGDSARGKIRSVRAKRQPLGRLHAGDEHHGKHARKYPYF